MKEECPSDRTGPHQGWRELETAVRRLVDAEKRFKESTDAVQQLHNEIDKRTASALLLDKELAERTALALRLNSELDEMKVSVRQLETALEEITWARRIDRRIQKCYGYCGRLIRDCRNWFSSTAVSP
jgi:predicted RNase H-like nuclease (RuvC/YqgF family)